MITPNSLSQFFPVRLIKYLPSSPIWPDYLGVILHVLVTILAYHIGCRLARTLFNAPLDSFRSHTTSLLHKDVGAAEVAATSTQLAYLTRYLFYCGAEKKRTCLALENLEFRYNRLEDELLTGQMQLFSEERQSNFHQPQQQFYKRHRELRAIEIELEEMHPRKEAMKATINKLTKEIAASTKNRDNLIAEEEERKGKERIDATVEEIATLRERLDNMREDEPEREHLQALITSLETNLSQYVETQALRQEYRELKAALHEARFLSTQVQEKIAETEFHLGLVHAALGRRNGLVSRPMSDL